MFFRLFIFYGIKKMKHQKPLAVRIFIRICVAAMVISLIWGYLAYMFVPSQEAWEDTQWNDVDTWNMEEVNLDMDEPAEDETWTTEETQIILPEVNPDEPENTEAPILITEDWEVDEMDQAFEVQLENWETELVKQWDLWDSIQID